MKSPNSYTAFGHIEKHYQTGSFCLFSGELFNKKLDAYGLGNGHRFYSPSLMRFFSPDRESPFKKGGINIYTYCSNDPINHVDPSGRIRFRTLAKTTSKLLTALRDRQFSAGVTKLLNIEPVRNQIFKHLNITTDKMRLHALPTGSRYIFSKTQELNIAALEKQQKYLQQLMDRSPTIIPLATERDFTSSERLIFKENTAYRDIEIQTRQDELIQLSFDTRYDVEYELETINSQLRNYRT